MNPLNRKLTKSQAAKIRAALILRARKLKAAGKGGCGCGGKCGGCKEGH